MPDRRAVEVSDFDHLGTRFNPNLLNAARRAWSAVMLF
jgi:hypothetical protein